MNFEDNRRNRRVELICECREVRSDRDDRCDNSYTNIMIDIVKMSLNAIAERIIADEIISGGKITKILTPTMLIL